MRKRTGRDFMIREKDVRIGDDVIVHKAGDIIPEVIGPVREHRDGTQVPYVFPSVCPVCGSPIHRFEDEAAHYCMMRRKEGNVDYKFFPEPNIFPIRLDPEWIRGIQASMPELPEARRQRYAKEYGLGEHVYPF